MVIANNVSANMILGNLNRNTNKKTKAAKQLALGEKICSAGDDASSYAISEKMRVSIRSLNQADANVQNGASMLRVAEGAIQSQINLLRTVKERVINAHNDTNTDADRLIIQKEITQYYQEINDIAAETTFNGKHLLMGSKVQESVKSWFKLDHAEKLEGSDTLGLISGTDPTLDNQEGPFAIFGTDTNLDGYSVKTIDPKTIPGYDRDASTSATQSNMHGGTASLPNDISLMISAYNPTVHTEDLNNTAFKIIYPINDDEIGEETFVFTYNMDNKYKGTNINKVNLNGEGEMTALSQIMELLQSRISHMVAAYNTSGAYRTITLTTVRTGEVTNDTNKYNIVAVELPEGDGYTGAKKITEVDGVTIVNEQHGYDGDTAYWAWDLSDYNNNNSSTAENLIASLLGKNIKHSGLSTTIEFIDSSKYPTTDSITKIGGAAAIDLNQLRGAAASGTTVAKALADLVISTMGSSNVKTITNTSGEVIGMKFMATVPGTAGNDQYISLQEGDLRDYTINFKSLLDGNSDIPGTLDGKGFRFYDATNKNQWVNVLFVNGVNPNDDPRPASGIGDMDIDTLVIDVSDVTDLTSFMRTLYQGDGDKNYQGLSQFLEQSSQNFRVAADYDNGTLTIYDNRKYPVWDHQTEKGAKIADGIVDNVVNDYRNIYANDLVIQHTDKSSANIHVIIPQTTMDHIFGYKIGAGSLDDYSVLTSEKREMLLGRDTPVKEKGALDKGLQYLIDANTLIGAQINHMENADNNLVTVIENTTAAESVMRDSDMAKSAMDLAKYNILSQSTMAMLSQFNHNSSDVLNLLQ